MCESCDQEWATSTELGVQKGIWCGGFDIEVPAALAHSGAWEWVVRILAMLHDGISGDTRCTGRETRE